MKTKASSPKSKQVQGLAEILRLILSFIMGLFGLNGARGKGQDSVDFGSSRVIDEDLRGLLTEEDLGYTYNDDHLHTARSFSNRVFEKNMAVIHFSWTETLEELTRWFSDLIPKNTANSTWGVGKDGTTHRYLPDIRFPSWTNNGMHAGKTVHARYIDTDGKLVSGQYVNNRSCAFEVVNRNYGPYTEAQYDAVAQRLIYMLWRFPEFRAWRVIGHEHLVPIAKDDPGKHWDWEKLFWKVGVRKNFYHEYLSFLQETASPTVGDAARSQRKAAEIKEALAKIGRDLSGRARDFCF